ncbi:MAG: hypothetical protein ABJF10_02855 [Chthoniobacter sp.]|uniref:hypothetical protein n=1 Tax=Chthoniobacter sp. TaxID=2510640 RepID=UPI0032ABE64A
MKLLVVLLLVVHLLLHTAAAATGFKTERLSLYQPDEVLRARLTSTESLAEYFKKLEAVCTDFFATATEPETLHIVVAVKPGKQARFWFVSSTREDDKGLEPLRQKLEAVPPLEVFAGPLAFAISARIAGGDGKNGFKDKNVGPPIPKEWAEAVKGAKSPVQVPDGFLAAAWPDAPGIATAVPAPAGFVNQVLEPTGGRIFRPKDWFYVENHHGPVYMWTLSREDSADDHAYATGVRIQLFTGVQKGTGKTPQEFILQFVANKTKQVKVIKSCEAKDQGLFTRMCLETEEGPYHILYSLFWGSKDLDLAVISISGTTKELWDKYSPTFDRMSEFELIDMKRFEPAKEIDPPMTRIESRQISPQIAPDSFAAKPKILYRAGTSYLRSEEQLDPERKLQQLILVHEPDIWFCNLVAHEGEHILDHGPTYAVHAQILTKGPTFFSTLEFGNEARFFADHHATALPAQTLDGQACEVSELKGGTYRLVLFLRTDTHQPFHLAVFKDDKPDFSLRYLNYQTDLPFDAALFTPPKDVTITEEKPEAEK